MTTQGRGHILGTRTYPEGEEARAAGVRIHGQQCRCSEWNCVTRETDLSYRDAVRNLSRDFAARISFWSRVWITTRVSDRIRETRRRRPLHLRLREWSPILAADVQESSAFCTVCRWRGQRFIGDHHSESGVCPRCKSVARDRFLHLARLQRIKHKPGMRVLETSPRLGIGYRRALRKSVTYVASDFDDNLHRGDITLDLEAMNLTDESVDLILSAHVLEHLRNPVVALAEMFRVLSPGGELLLQVPLHQTATSAPPTAEFHADNTPVFWRFGFDLTDLLRATGFKVSLLVTEDMYRRVSAPDQHSADDDPDVDVSGITQKAPIHDLSILASADLARAAWLEPSYMFWVWHARKI
jgi:hypothetical protein